MYATFCVSIFVTIIRLIVCEDECGPPREVDRAQVSNPSDSGYAVGSTVTYKCDFGFISRDLVKTSRCVRDPTTNEPIWTEPEIMCNHRSCGDPGLVENARRIGSRFTFPNHVEYACNVGYSITGFARRYCEASGVWSGKLPSCNIISCERPEDPENGKAVYTSLTYNSILRYECNKDLQISPKEPRFCSPEGRWTGTKPVCREIECEMPDKPEFGSMELVGNKPKVGSIVVYKCDPGRKILGSSNSKCLKSGQWTFPTPQCIEPCIILDVANGQLGKYEEEYKRYRWRTVFKQARTGTTVDENEQVTLKCDENYVPRTEPRREITITCQGGQLTPNPECITTNCLGDPPPVENARAVVSYRHHGHVIYYVCHGGYEKDKDGKIECSYGSWTGYTPSCKYTQCDKSSLNYPGLVRSEGFLFNKKSFEPTCLSGYEVTEKEDKKIYCEEGRWTGNLPPCTAAQCKTAELAGFNGLVLQGSRTLDDGEWFQPTCAEGFEFSSKLDSKIYCREGVWQGNLPPCSPAHCSNNPPVPENGRIKSLGGTGHGSFVQYECLPMYEMEGESSVVCNHGQWAGSSPNCKDSRCYLRNLHEKEGVDLTSDIPVPANRRATIKCIRGYTLRYPDVYCERGGWRTENLLSPCQENECEVKQIANGKMLKERNIPVKNFFGRVTGMDTVREPADIGSSESSGAVLYVECYKPYRFQGDSDEEQVRITCRRGEWIPSPVCTMHGRPLEAELSEADEVTRANPVVLPTQQFMKLNDSMVKKMSTDHNTSINNSQQTSTNNSLEDLDGSSEVLENNSTESGDVATDATDIPPCSCTYILKDPFLIAHDGKKVVKYGDEVPSGTVISFYCNSTGYFRFRGHSSLMCPADCNWHSSMFPSCVSPNDEDVIITVSAEPPKNMEVGPGGVLSVIPGTRLHLACRMKTNSRKVDWIIPSSNGYKFHEGEKSDGQRLTNGVANRTSLLGIDVNDKGVFRMWYIVTEASSVNSGKYTCFNERENTFHSIQIDVRDVECREIEKTEELGISYTPNRKFGGRATFHCFSPYRRNGPSYVTCEASGFWSGLPASCSLPRCSIESLYDIIPEGVVPLIDGDIGESLPFGYELRIGCDEEGRVLKGGSAATCSTDGIWRAGSNLECVQGCASLQKKNGSELQISPNKEVYNMGDSVIFSCPEGKDLTIDVQRILCFKNGWTPNTVPDCQ